LIQAAQDAGVDGTSFKTCLNSGKYETLVQQDTADGDKAGITGTPGNTIINNETGEAVPMDGAQTIDKFKVIIDEMLKK
jgi:predicted DsbA family dithiol-disulfide isomerase